MLVTVFHPELTDDLRLHELFVSMIGSPAMRDQRAEALAKILVGYSTAVKKGDVCIVGGETTSEPLALAVYEEIVKAGGHAIVNMSMDGAAAGLLRARLRRAARLGRADRRSGPRTKPT